LSFQRIAAIREAFFPAGGTPQLNFALSPAPGSDPSAALLIGGTSVGKDPNQASSFSWSSGLSVASLSFDNQASARNPANIFKLTNPNAGQQPQLQFNGSWAFF
jgi:type VI secretion system protein ImpL